MYIIEVRNNATGEAIQYQSTQIDLAREVATQLSTYTRQTWVVVRGVWKEEE